MEDTASTPTSTHCTSRIRHVTVYGRRKAFAYKSTEAEARFRYRPSFIPKAAKAGDIQRFFTISAGGMWLSERERHSIWTSKSEKCEVNQDAESRRAKITNFLFLIRDFTGAGLPRGLAMRRYSQPNYIPRFCISAIYIENSVHWVYIYGEPNTISYEEFTFCRLSFCFSFSIF